jgi:hypothetical protein
MPFCLVGIFRKHLNAASQCNSRVSLTCRRRKGIDEMLMGRCVGAMRCIAVGGVGKSGCAGAEVRFAPPFSEDGSLCSRELKMILLLQ